MNTNTPTEEIQQWEYEVKHSDRIGLYEWLNKMGIEGWELCATLPTEKYTEWYVFKRPKSPNPITTTP
jgi:hypothetical protein